MNINGMITRSNAETLNSNLCKLKEREAITKELRALAIKDAVFSPNDAPDIKELALTYEKYMPQDLLYSISDRTLFCNNLYDATKIQLHQIEKVCDTNIIASLAYVKNQYSEEAVNKLEKTFTFNKKKNYRSFGEICEDIESGICDACIVPIENTSDGKLMNFYSMIDRFDLKIAGTCDVENQSGDQITRYALLRNMLTAPQSVEQCYLEFSFISSETISLSDIIISAEISDLTLYRLDSMPLRYNDSEFIYYTILMGSANNLIRFALFLKLNLSQYTTVGIYSRIK